jgi:hypothetical protein
VIEVKNLVDTACERAGSDDFGPDTWREGLDILVRSLVGEGSLNELGEQVFANQIIDYLVNRLEIEKWYGQHPEIDDEEILAPTFGLGLPRTGSTALSFLIACDRTRRSLRSWEASIPCPPPEKATEDTDPRIALSQIGIDMSPDFAGMLPSSPTGPQECLLIMALDFRSMVFEGMALLPSYTSWLLSCDMRPAYEYHKRVLKLLQWHCPPKRWSLKTPAHMASIDALDSVYPDARFIMTHRDIASVLPSVCALKVALSTPVTEPVNVLNLGRHEKDLWHESLRRLIEFRDADNESRFFDVSFSKMQSDPLKAIDVLYAEMGDELSVDTSERMAEWWAESSTERKRGPRPDPTVYGFDIESLRKEFAFYHDRFSVILDA